MFEEWHAESVPDSAESCSCCSDFNRRLCTSSSGGCEDGFVAAFCTCRSVKRSYFFFHKCNEREQTGTLQSHHQEREGERRRRGGWHKDGKLNCHSSFHLLIVREVGKPYPLSLFLCIFIPATFSLYTVPLISGRPIYLQEAAL